MEQEKVLIEGAKELGVVLTSKQVKQFMQYKSLLVEWNQKMNLTAITEDYEVITKHFLDCLTAHQAIDLNTVNTVVDIGTGAGFPGLVLKIAFPHLQITLVDSLKKRLTFLETVIDTLNLDGICCIHSRAEDLGKQKQYRESFDICASRAVAHLAILSEYTLPFVKVGGYLIALKGQKLEEELQDSKRAVKVLGGSLEKAVQATIPFTDIHHRIALIKKVKPSPKQYPRKAGEPTKAPIGIEKK